MLIEFSVANFMSIKDRQTLSMVKAKGDELVATNTFEYNSISLLKSTAIYGPNAAGKSNLIFALDIMEEIVTGSASEKQRGDKLSITPFRLDGKSISEPSLFEVIFIAEDNIRYQYGFVADEDKIYEEWLMSFPKGPARKLYTRLWNNKSKDYDWKFSNNFHGEKQIWCKATRNNALFLSTAVQLNSAQLQPVYDWFKYILRGIGVNGFSPHYSASLCEREDKTKMLKFLKAADLDIQDVIVERKKMENIDFPDGMPEVVKNAMKKEMEGREYMEIKTVHKREDGEIEFFSLEEESLGTQKFFSFAGPLIDTLKNGYVLIVDELNNSLHPELVKFFVKLFHDEKTNPKNAQLIFTTHETALLNQNIFRRDQIWFCQKSEEKATEVVPLVDYSPLKRDNLESSYLSGRYNALPYISKVASF